MTGPHNEQSQQNAEEDESTFAWDEASVLI